MKKAIILALVCISVVINLCNAQNLKPTGPRLRVAQYVDATSWPMSRNGTNGLEGYEPAVATTICAILNATCDLVPVTDLEERFSIVDLSGGANFSLGTISVTEERKKLVDFVQPYYYSSGTTLFAPENTSIVAANGWEALRGKTVCVEKGDISVEVIKNNGMEIYIIPSADIPVDQRAAFVNQLINTGTCIASASDFTMVAHFGNPPVGLPPLDELPYGIAVAKGNNDLLRTLSGVMVEMMRDGNASDILQLETDYLTKEGVPKNAQLADVVMAISDFDINDNDTADVQTSSATFALERRWAGATVLAVAVTSLMLLV